MLRNLAPRQPWPVRRYLSLIAVIAVTAFVAATGYGYLWSAHRAADRAVADLDFLAARASAAVAADLAGARESVQRLAEQAGLAAALGTPAATARACRLAPIGVRSFPSLRLDLVRADGQVACSSGTAAGRRFHAGSRWLAPALRATGSTVYWNETDTATGRPAVVITAALGPAPGAGLVVLVLHTDVAGRALAEALGGPRGVGFTVVDGLLGQVVSASLQAGAAGAGGEFFERDAGRWRALDGSRQLFASQPVDGSTWRVYAGLPSAEVLGAVRGATLRQSGVGLLALLLVLAAVAVLNRRVARPLGAVTEAVVRAGRNPGLLRVPPGGTSELVTLAAGVNAMLDVRAGVEAELVHQAGHDRLTGLPNRDLVLERLEELLAAGGTGTCAVLSLGLNRFNLVNDSVGHETADRVLVEVAQRLAALLPDGAMLSRHEGAEFIVVCPGTDAEAAAALADRLDTAVGRPLGGQAARIALSLTAGIAVPQHRTRPEDLLGEAHTAMHQARAAGAGRARFDPAYQAGVTARLRTERDLRLAIERGEFVLRYQPLLDVASGRHHRGRGAGALAAPGARPAAAAATSSRWPSRPARSSRSASSCCRRPAGRRSAWAARRAPAADLGERRRRPVPPHDFSPDMAERALGRLAGWPPDHLCLEITESP